MQNLTRRQLLALAAGSASLAAEAPQERPGAPKSKEITLRDTLPVQMFGKTGHRLPLLCCGGSAMVQKWAAGYGVQLPAFANRVVMIRHAYELGVRYFDTARNYGESESIVGEALKDVRGNIYLATKVGVRADDQGIIEAPQVRASVEESLRMLKTDYVDCIQIHGPTYEYMGYGRAMQIYEELVKLREERLFRFIGVTGHTAFETMHRLVDTRLFDQVFLAYGYFPKGMDTMLSHANLQWRELVLSRARELGMGILAMKVLGSFVLGHNAGKIVPEFDAKKLRAVRQAALRWALRDKQPPLLVVGVSLPGDIEENIETLRGDRTFTAEDQKLLAEFSTKALQSSVIQGLKTT